MLNLFTNETYWRIPPSTPEESELQKVIGIIVFMVYWRTILFDGILMWCQARPGLSLPSTERRLRSTTPPLQDGVYICRSPGFRFSVHPAQPSNCGFACSGNCKRDCWYDRSMPVSGLRSQFLRRCSTALLTARTEFWCWYDVGIPADNGNARLFH